MFTVDSSIHIDRPQEEVWAYSSDPERFIEWCGSVARVELPANGSFGVGSEMVLVERLMGREMSKTARYSAWEPPRQFRYDADGGAIRYSVTQTSESVNGGTQVTTHLEVEVDGFLKAAKGMVKRELSKQITDDLGRLKKVLEG